MDHQLLQRAFGALLGLLDGSIVIGGHEAQGLHDDPVVRLLYDSGMLRPVYFGHSQRWLLTLQGFRAAESIARVAAEVRQ